MKLSLTPYSKEKVLYIDDKCSLSFYKGYLIFHQVGASPKRVKIGTLLNSFPLVQRAMRLEPKCAIRLNGEFLVSFNGCVYNYKPQLNKLSIEHHYCRGMNNPTHFSLIKNDVYYGEYFGNEKKSPVSVFKREKNEWKKVFEFPSGTITHIHNVIYDEFREKVLILTGDEDSESGIWVTDESFSVVKPLVLGKQQYRACVAFAIPEGLIYATDTPTQQNHIYCLKAKQGKYTSEIVSLFLLPGPCIYGTEHQGNQFYATSVEPDSLLPKWRYRISYKLGAGVVSRYSHIIQRDTNGKFEDYLSIKKDLLPIWLFQFGNIQFPTNLTDNLLIVPQSTTIGHCRTFMVLK